MLNLSTEPSLGNLPYKDPCSPLTVSASKPDRAGEVWAGLEAIRFEVDAKARPLKLTKARRRMLNGRLKEHTVEDLQAVWVWWLTSEHDRAVFLRSKFTVDTLLRGSNFAGYLDLSQVPDLVEGPDASIPASPMVAWKRIEASLTEQVSNVCPGPDSGWHLWPLGKDPRVHEAIMDALCAATDQEYRPYAWQMVQQASRRGANRYELNQIGAAFRRVYPSTWSSRVAA